MAPVNFHLLKLKICNFRKPILRYVKLTYVAINELPVLFWADTFTRISQHSSPENSCFGEFFFCEVLVINMWQYLLLRWEHCERRKEIYQKPPGNIWWFVRVPYRRSEWIVFSEWRWVNRYPSLRSYVLLLLYYVQLFFCLSVIKWACWRLC